MRACLLVVISGLAVLATAGSAMAALQQTIDPSYQTNGAVRAIIRSGGVVYIGGDFTSVRTAGSPLGTNETPRHDLAAFDAHTGALLPWDPGANGTVHALAMGPGGGTVFIGGDFTTLGGQPRNHIGAVSTTGTTLNWNPNADGSVEAIVTMGSRIFIGGEFMNIGTVHRKRLAAITSTGALTTWAEHNGPNHGVKALLISPNGTRIFAGGLFTTVGGVGVQHLVALSAGTGARVPWVSHPRYEVLGLAETSSYLFAAGGGGGGHLPSYKLSDGSLRWTASPDGDVASVSIYHGEVLAGGHFNQMGAQVRHHAALLNPTTGKVDLTWAPDFNQVLGVWPVLGYGQQAYAGGDFTKVGSVDQQGLAQFSDSVVDTTAPTLTALPNVHMAVGTTIGASVPVTLAWKGSDAVSGICRYSVRQAVNAGAPVNVIPARPTNTSVGRGLVPSTNVYHFSVQATDCSDNATAYIAGPTAQVVSVQNTNPLIKYSGVWRRLPSAGTAGGSITSTSAKNASAKLTFTGRQVAWVASKSKLRGQAAVYIDGVKVKTVDLHNPSLVKRRAVFTHGWTSNGTHTIRIVALGTPGRPAVDIDTLLTLK